MDIIHCPTRAVGSEAEVDGYCRESQNNIEHI
jgi:hypothetical protein